MNSCLPTTWAWGKGCMWSRAQAQSWDEPGVSGPTDWCCQRLAVALATLRLILLSLQTHVTMGVPALMVSTRPSATACLASRVPSVRKTSTNVPAIPAEMVPTAPTAWTVTRAPAPRASTASTVRITYPTAPRGGSHQPGLRQGKEWMVGGHTGTHSMAPQASVLPRPSGHSALIELDPALFIMLQCPS